MGKRRSVWTEGPSEALVPRSSAAEGSARALRQVYHTVVIDGRNEIASGAGEKLREKEGVSTGWSDPRTIEIRSYAVAGDLQLSDELRARGGWRGPHATQRGSQVYELATGLIREAAQVVNSIRSEPDCIDSGWNVGRRDALLHRLLTGETRPNPVLGRDEAENFCLLATACAEAVREQPTVVCVPAPCKVFGDVHGQLRSLLLLFSVYGFPSHGIGDVQSITYVFNGDFVDRGPHQLEVVALLFALKIVYPERVFLIRGNHEFRSVNENLGACGFKAHCKSRFPAPFGWKLYDTSHQTFELLPLAAWLGHAVMVMHGGVGDGSWDIHDLAHVERPLRELEVRDDALAESVVARAAFHAVWSDPSDSDHFMRRGVHQSGRGEHVPEFGPDVTIDFCRRNDIKVVIRSHQFVKEGFKVMHAGHLITVFSARDYFVDVDNAAQEKGNDAAMLLLTPDRNGDLRIHPKQVSGCRSGVAASLRNKKMQEKLDVARVLVSRGRSVFLWVITCGGEGGLRGADRRTSPMRRRQSSS